ncbi:ABC transporter permease [Kitasatospora sp. NPDC005856]|uniref:ABC transporter permease n=1 Tax=Kitasatospora sp. NPDC005856 TaxID=3154566 RepID=UPI0033E830FA
MTTYRYTVAELRGQLRQLLLSGAAIALGVAFLIASVSGSGALVDSYSQTAAAEVGPGDIQVTGKAAAGGLDAAAAEQVRQTPGVAAVAPRLTGKGGVLAADGRPLDRGAAVSAVAEDPALRWQLLKDGRWPTGPGEVLLDTGTAHRLDAAVGADVHLTRADGTAATARLVGTLDERGAPSLAGVPIIGVPAGAVAGYATGVTTDRLDVRVVPGASRAGTVEALRAALGAGAQVHTREASVTEATRQSSTLYGVVLIAALSFVLIALAVARMVVGNTFTVVLAQRTRQLALLRCVGADRQQLRRLIRRQGLLLGVGASTAGVLLGVALGALGTAVVGGLDLGPVHLSLMPSPLTCLPAGLFGVLLTLLAVRGPAKAAAAVPPIAALGGTPAPAGGAARVRAAVWTTVLLVAGTALLVAGAVAPPPLSLLAVTVGAIANFFGVLRLSHRVLPAVVAVLGRPARRLGGTAGRLATQQLRLNPGRTGATGSALLLGVTVMVGAVTALDITSQSLVPVMSARQPGVFSAAATGAALPTGVLGALGAEHGLTVTPVRSATVDLDGRPTVVAAVDPTRLNSSTDDVDRARALTGGAALSGLGETGVRRVGGVELRLQPGRSSLPFTLQSGATLLVTPATLDRLAPGASVTTAWISPAAGDDRPTARRALDRALADHPQVTVADTAAQADTLRSLLDRLKTVSMALLSFSVAIAGLGVAATLMLSISERSREIGMLRAIGMSREQLRRMLTLEALLLSLAGALVGTALGAAYGWAAARSITSTVGTVGTPPVLPVLAALALTVLVGLAAAVLPARRVGRMSAVAAMRAS